MRAVNLLPRDTIVLEDPSFVSVLPVLGAAIVPILAAGLVAIGYSSANALVTSRTNELANLEAAMPATIPAKVAAAAPGLSIINASISARESALSTALASQVPWDTTLNDIARVIPTGVWLTSLSAQSPSTPVAPPPPAATTTGATTTTAASTPPPAPAPSTAAFTMVGDAYSEQDVAELLSRLQVLPTLMNVNLTSDTSTQVGTKNVISFNITANVQPMAASGA